MRLRYWLRVYFLLSLFSFMLGHLIIEQDSKPTRMMLLSLTDGVVDFQGMEYQPIPQLSVQTVHPGAKVSNITVWYHRVGRLYVGMALSCHMLYYKWKPGKVLLKQQLRLYGHPTSYSSGLYSTITWKLYARTLVLACLASSTRARSQARLPRVWAIYMYMIATMVCTRMSMWVRVSSASMRVRVRFHVSYSIAYCLWTESVSILAQRDY